MDKNDFFKMRKDLKNCETVYKTIFVLNLAYVIMFAVYTFLELIVFMLARRNPLGLFFDGIILHGLYLFFSINGGYKKNIKYSILASIIMAISFLIPSGTAMNNFDLMFAIESALFIIPTTLANKKYKWLEQQEGFPYFNERFEQQKNKLKEYNEKNPYEERMKQIQQNSSGKMDEL